MDLSGLKGRTIGAAVSGGLDSCTFTRWLTDHGIDVVCLTADLGQPDEERIDYVAERMMLCGAKEVVIVDAKEQLAQAGIEVIQSQAMYEGNYWNTTGIARHVTVRTLLPELKKRGINVLSHGATGRGNDQVRFQLVTNMIDPTVEVYAPWRDQIFLDDFPGRKEMIDFCESRKLPIQASHEKPYSTDANILGLTHEAGRLESLETPAKFINPGMGVHPQEAPDSSENFAVRFELGVPTQINKEPVTPLSAIEIANQIGGRHGVGIGIHTVENRFVGIKSRGVYESPAMSLLGQCYEFLLQLILDRRARRTFDQTSAVIAEQIYQGYWYDPSTQALRASVDVFNKLATGTVRVELYKGNVSFQSADDVPHSLYSEATASMEDVGDFDHKDSEGFLGVLGVSARALKSSNQIQ